MSGNDCPTHTVRGRFQGTRSRSKGRDTGVGGGRSSGGGCPRIMEPLQVVPQVNKGLEGHKVGVDRLGHPSSPLSQNVRTRDLHRHRVPSLLPSSPCTSLFCFFVSTASRLSHPPLRGTEGCSGVGVIFGSMGPGVCVALYASVWSCLCISVRASLGPLWTYNSLWCGPTGLDLSVPVRVCVGTSLH